MPPSGRVNEPLTGTPACGQGTAAGENAKASSRKRYREVAPVEKGRAVEE